MKSVLKQICCFITTVVSLKDLTQQVQGDTIQLNPREGVIIEWPLNGQFHDAVTDVLTSWIDVRDLADDELMLGTLIICYKSLKWRFLTIFWLKTLENVILTTTFWVKKTLGIVILTTYSVVS